MPQCANPLLLEWVGEWLENARAHSTKGVTTYKKAYDSLKACPIPFEHPSEAMQLKGLGDKLCARLTDKLVQHCQQNGLPMPVMPHKRKKARKAPAGTNAGDDDDDDEDEAPAPKRVRKEKPYVPKLGSGPYAILLALSEVYENEPDGITKARLIELAQPHCDSSFTAVNPGAAKYYTAWNSMKTLETKDLVIEVKRRSTITLYGLTEDGWDTVQRMKNVLEPGQQTLGNSSKSKGTTARSSLRKDDSDNDDEHDNASMEAEPAPRSKNPYLREDDNFQDIGSLVLTSPKTKKKRPNPSKGNSRSREDPAPSTSRALSNPYARDDDNFVDIGEVLGVAASRPQGARNPYLRDDDGFQDLGTDGTVQRRDTSNPGAERSRTTASRAPRSGIGIGQTGSGSRENVTATESAETETETANVVRLGSPSDKTTIPKFTPFVLPPSAFSVYLILDNREVRTQKDRDYLENKLLEGGVKLIKRPLVMGDMLWVAKCNEPNYLARFGEEGDEIMLDHIIERKRMDDLISSIQDKRYDEQKFRLTRSGVKNVTYIVEEISLTKEHTDHYEARVESAIASMQMVNGFFVKKTSGMDETIRYLTRMTRLLNTVYSEKPLKIIPTETFTLSNYQRLRTHLAEKEPSTDYYITYPAFSNLSSKSGNLCLRDVYLKMLMCTKGITGEKALDIQRHWKTPYELVKAFQALGEGKEAEKQKSELLSKTLDHVVSRKKVHKALSMRIAAVWGDVKEG